MFRSRPKPPVSADEWFRHLFKAQAAMDGAIVRRKTADMERIVGRARFLSEMERRGFTVMENAGQLVIFCNTAPVHCIAGQGAKPSQKVWPANPLRGFGRRLS